MAGAEKNDDFAARAAGVAVDALFLARPVNLLGTF